MIVQGESLRLGVGGLLSAAAIGAAMTELPASYSIALAGAAGYVGFLLWELARSRRRLVEEHAANVAKSAYLANMSHEMRTPLNAIIGFSELIGEELWPPGRPKHVEYAKDIHESATHLLDVMNDVFDIARIETGHFTLNESEVELAALVGSCVRLLRERARSAGVSLDVDTHAATLTIRCDPSKVKQILLNLMTNAIKFTPRGGMVAVSAKADAHAIRVEIADSGIGIPEKDIRRVFTPFYQSAHTRLMPNEGAGLGLPLARRLAELHGGSLRINSRPGWGTRVTLCLPPTRLIRSEERLSLAAAVQNA